MLSEEFLQDDLDDKSSKARDMWTKLKMNKSLQNNNSNNNMKFSVITAEEKYANASNMSYDELCVLLYEIRKLYIITNSEFDSILLKNMYNSIEIITQKANEFTQEHKSVL